MGAKRHCETWPQCRALYCSKSDGAYRCYARSGGTFAPLRHAGDTSYFLSQKRLGCQDGGINPVGAWMVYITEKEPGVVPLPANKGIKGVCTSWDSPAAVRGT